VHNLRLNCLVSFDKFLRSTRLSPQLGDSSTASDHRKEDEVRSEHSKPNVSNYRTSPVKKPRICHAKNERASVIDSQLVMTTETAGPCGYDAGKKIKVNTV